VIAGQPATSGASTVRSYAQAGETAGDDGVDIAGGASAVRQALVAGVVEVLHSPLATHIRYRRVS
jgi:hypothetical protein